MATDGTIIQSWKKFSETMSPTDAAVRLYRLAEEAGKQESLRAMEKELLSDEVIESALKTFGWGRGKKSTIVTQRAILRRAIRLANGNQEL